jgi:hypothetical protein
MTGGAMPRPLTSLADIQAKPLERRKGRGNPATLPEIRLHSAIVNPRETNTWLMRLPKLQVLLTVASQKKEPPLMTKYAAILALAAFVAFPAYAQQKPAAGDDKEQTAPKPTKAEVDKVVKSISGDPAKSKQYCDMVKAYNAAYEAGEKKDDKKADELSQQADKMSDALGADYAKVIDGLSDVDPESAEGKELFASFEPLDSKCPE